MANQSNQLFLLMIVTVSSRNIQRALRDQKKIKVETSMEYVRMYWSNIFYRKKNNFEYDLKQFTK